MLMRTRRCASHLRTTGAKRGVRAYSAGWLVCMVSLKRRQRGLFISLFLLPATLGNGKNAENTTFAGRHHPRPLQAHTHIRTPEMDFGPIPRYATSPNRHISPGRTVFSSELPARRSPQRREYLNEENLPRLAHRMGARRMRRFCNDNFVDSPIFMDGDEVCGLPFSLPPNVFSSL